MRRRAALAACAAWSARSWPGVAAALGTAVGLTGCRTPPRTADAATDWTGTGFAVQCGPLVLLGRIDSPALERLPLAGAPACPPAPGAHGLWIAEPGAGLGCWRHDGDAVRRVILHADAAPAHALAAERDGPHLIAAHDERLTVFDAERGVLKTLAGRDLHSRAGGRASALFAHGGRRSMLALWPGLGELWEIGLDPAAAPIFDGLVHDYRMGEAIGAPGHLGVRRTRLDARDPEAAAFAWGDGRVPWVALAQAPAEPLGAGGRPGGVAIVHLDVRRRVARLDDAVWAQARPGAAALTEPATALDGAPRWCVPAGPDVLEIDARNWRLLASRALPGPAPVIALLAGGPRLWAWRQDTAGTASLWTRSPPSGWHELQRLQGRAGPIALGAGAPPRLLAATAAPHALHLLDEGGHSLRRWPLPAAAAGLWWT